MVRENKTKKDSSMNIQAEEKFLEFLIKYEHGSFVDGTKIGTIEEIQKDKDSHTECIYTDQGPIVRSFELGKDADDFSKRKSIQGYIPMKIKQKGDSEDYVSYAYVNVTVTQKSNGDEIIVGFMRKLNERIQVVEKEDAINMFDWLNNLFNKEEFLINRANKNENNQPGNGAC